MADVLDAAVTGNLWVGLGNQWRVRTGALRVLLPRPRRAPGRWSPRRINKLVRGLPHARRYLEIGVEYGYTLEGVDVAARWGVDPNPRFDVSRLPENVTFFHGTSDQFFAQLPADTQFDVVFLDGLHTFEQTLEDLLDALAHARDGAVLIDDTVPADETSAIADRQDSYAQRRASAPEPGLWHGDVWKLVMYIGRQHPDLEHRTIVGSGNPQTLVWRRDGRADIGDPNGAAVADCASLSYGAVFADGLPAAFRPCAEDEAISDCVAGLKARRT